MTERTLNEYQGIRACLDYRDPQQIRITGQFQILLDSDCPKDEFHYDHHHRLTAVTLWGKNVDTLKKAARFILV